MLMQPKSPSPEYDFMLKENKPTKRSLSMPNLPKPVLIGLAVVGGLILIIIISSVLSSSRKSSTQPFVNALARAQETLRVTQLVQHQLNPPDPQTQTLAATVNSALSSDKQQLTSYLLKNKVKVSKTQLSADVDKSIDTSLQTASQNNGLDTAYINYVRNALTRYQSDLQTALSGTGPNGKKLLSSSIESTRAIINSAPVKS
jgi:hypothetical protein